MSIRRTLKGTYNLIRDSLAGEELSRDAQRGFVRESMFQSKANSYALLALLELAKRGGKTGIQAQEIASRYELPTAYAAKVMSQLAKAGVLQSYRGPRGGFMLSRSAKDISLLAVFEAVNGPLTDPTILPPNAPKALRNNVDSVFGKVVAETRKQLAKMSLDDLAESGPTRLR